MDNKTINTRGKFLWLAQITLGILLVILLGIHLVVNHLVAPHGLLTYSEIMDYYKYPGIALMESVFLIVVTSHSLLGLHSILLDFNPPLPVLRIIVNFMFILGAAIIFYGLRLIIAIS